MIVRFRPMVFGILLGCWLSGGAVFVVAEEEPEAGSEADQANCAKLSDLGVDFGAAELVRYTKLDLSGEQKKRVLGVVRDRQPRIEKLCDQMTRALVLNEVTLEEKKIKEATLAEILGRFKAMQEEILKELHGLVTPEQMLKLDLIKQKEAEEAAAAAKKVESEVREAG